ncbi:MAG: tRNA pseudouridine(38-40) synthase TruA [Desulfurella sp.]|uniref:tRNA pseudouridine(38-40) synthase TruA n=1 Tax=Desulfurella sp. TaxID=1962857 RepID=UPI003CA040A5
MSYDGSYFHGMQIQKNKFTVQQEVESALKKLFDFNVSINYAGRTDAGVHALGQVVDFYIDKTLDVQVIKKALNALLKPEVRVLGAYRVPDVFHSRYSCIFRDYVYIINTADVCMPFLKNYVWHVPKLNISRLLDVKDLFVGYRNFVFLSKGSKNKQTYRFVKYIRFKQKGYFAIFFIRGQAFLRGMVRLIIGAIVAYARGIISIEQIENTLTATYRQNSLKAPACGLYFKRAIY